MYKSTIGNEKFCAIFETEESLKWPNSGQQLICNKEKEENYYQTVSIHYNLVGV